MSTREQLIAKASWWSGWCSDHDAELPDLAKLGGFLMDVKQRMAMDRKPAEIMPADIPPAAKTARALLSPDCREGKHRACRGESWDYELDQLADCTCNCHASVGLVKPAEDAFGITHGATVEQAVGLAASLIQTTVEAEQTVRRLEGVIEQKAIEEK